MLFFSNAGGRRPTILAGIHWSQSDVTMVGRGGEGEKFRELFWPSSLYVDDDQTLYIADTENQRILEWKKDATRGRMMPGGNESGNQMHQLNYPADLMVDSARDRLIICDKGNRRVVQCSRQYGTTRGQALLEDVCCEGLAMDDQRFLYVSDSEEHVVRRYSIGEATGIVVAGNREQGGGFNELNNPTYLFVDGEQSVFVSDTNNHRVMKWMKDAKQGVVVAGGYGQGDGLTQLSYPQGVFVDQLGTVYVSDTVNHRIMRWVNGKTQGDVIVGGNGTGTEANQLDWSEGLSFDRYGHLYVVDHDNYRVQRFSIE